MKAIVITALLALSGCCKQAQAADEWLAKDKYQHFAGSVGLGVVAGTLIEDRRVAFAAAMVPGVLKELYDAKHPDKHTASWKDLAWDAAGAYVGVQFGHLVVRKNFIGYQTEF